MNIRAVLLTIVIFFSFIGLAPADTPWNSTYWWHTMTQSQRNAAIVNRANQYLNQWVGLSCKEWVRKVVYEASGNHVTVPPTSPAPNDYMWQSDPSGQVVGMSMPIENVSVGHIIQMRLSSGWPHTAIVTAKTSTSVTFIESNWDSTPGDNSDAYVRTRTLTFSQFYSKLQSSGSFSVYFIQ